MKLSYTELQLFALLAEKGPMSIRQLVPAMQDRDGKERAYTTILSTCQVMEKKGALKHTKNGAVYFYEPAIDADKYMVSYMQDIVTNIFGGSKKAFNKVVNLVTFVPPVPSVKRLPKGK